MQTIRELRTAQEMSPVQLAATLGVSLATVYNWENGTHEPRASQLRDMARLFGVCMDDIDFGPGKRKPRRAAKPGGEGNP